MYLAETWVSVELKNILSFIAAFTTQGEVPCGDAAKAPAALPARGTAARLSDFAPFSQVPKAPHKIR